MSLPSYISDRIRKFVLSSQRMRSAIANGALFYSTLFPGEPKEPYTADAGFVDVEQDDNGNLIRKTERRGGDDTTYITERNPATGQFETHSYTPMKNPDGTWRLEKDLPRIYQFRPVEA